MALTRPWLAPLAQEGGPSLLPLPDWLADAPPWVQISAILLAVVGGVGGALAVATVGLWGPALAERIRGRPTTPAPPPPPPQDTGSSEAPAGSPTKGSGPALQQYDAKMALITQLTSGVQKSLDDAEDKIASLQATVDQLREQLAEARIEIGRLSYQRDMLMQRPVDPRPPGG